MAGNKVGIQGYDEQKVEQPLRADQWGHLFTDKAPLTIIVAYSGDNPEYVGWAAPGTATSASTWRIMKVTWSGSNPTNVKWADGDAKFDNVWDNRASYSYS